MNRTDRLLAIMLELQAKGRQKAEDLAATFNVTKRTIYRDLLTLGEAGVPVVAVPGQGYSLVEGYFLPPLSFTTDEAIMVLLGGGFVAQNVDAQYQTAARSATMKIEAVIGAELRAEVDFLKRSIQFITPATGRTELLAPLRRAIIQRRTVHFDYHTRHTLGNDQADNIRAVDPYALLHAAGAWYLVGYCHLRKGLRTFRLDRISGPLSVLNMPFVRPPNFAITPHSPQDRPITVRVLFDTESERWVKENPSFFQIAAEKSPEGWLVTLKIRQEEEIMQWLLGWGAHIHVLEPELLRVHLAAEIQAMARHYDFDSLLT